MAVEEAEEQAKMKRRDPAHFGLLIFLYGLGAVLLDLQETSLHACLVTRIATQKIEVKEWKRSSCCCLSSKY